MGCDFIALANVGIQGLQPYQAGQPIEELERELGISNIIKLASNENPLGLAKSAQQAIEQQLTTLTLYPDSNGFYLKQDLAQYFAIIPEQITLGNGSDDLLELIARVFIHDGDEVIYSQYAFIVYPLITQALNAKSVVIPARNWGHDLSAMLAAITNKTRLIFITNPNNPTGTFLEKEELADFIAKVPSHVLIVLDEAYTEYTPKERRSPSLAWIEQYPNVIVCRTFSKAYGLAGLRIGYAVSDLQIAGLLNRLRQPFNCNSLALAAARAVLQDHDYLTKTVELNQHGMRMLSQFCQAHQLEYIPSMGNFITINFTQPAQGIYQKLLAQGIIVRPLMSYGMPNHLRITIGLPEQNQRLIEALKEILLTDQ